MPSRYKVAKTTRSLPKSPVGQERIGRSLRTTSLHTSPQSESTPTTSVEGDAEDRLRTHNSANGKRSLATAGTATWASREFEPFAIVRQWEAA